MYSERGVGSDEVMRAVALVMEAGRDSLDWAAIARVVAENRLEVIERRRDRMAGAGWREEAPSRYLDESSLVAPVVDAEALTIKVQSILLAAVTRWGREWQRLVEDRAPGVRMALQECEATDSPGVVERQAVIEEVRSMFRDLGTLMRDQAALFEADLWKLQDELLPR